MGVSRPAKIMLGVAAASGLLGLGAALAETAASPLPAAVQRLLDCRSVPADTARLACYDAAVDELGRLIKAGDIVVIDHERVATVKRQAFGFSLPSLSLFDRGEKAAELQQVSGVIASAYRSSEGAWVVELEDGAVWRQTDNEQLARAPRRGSKAEIRKAALGSFFMNIDGQRALRMQRVK